MKKYLLVLMLVFFGLIFGGCGVEGNSGDPGLKPNKDNPSANQEEETEIDNGDTVGGEQPVAAKGPYEANEAGKVMVLMYHNIGYPEAEWTRTPENFRKDLERLYERGYRLISLSDYARGEINLPRGYAPVVLTFDDGSAGQFRLIKDELGNLNPDPESAVGILLDFAETHPGFGRAATFFTYYPLPFRQREYISDKYLMLQEFGMEIGNHTIGHQNLSKLSEIEVQRVLAEHQEETQKIIPGYEVLSLALPYGAKPKNVELSLAGSFKETSYRNLAVLLVGANPAPGPYSKKFRPEAVPRVWASEQYITQWMQYFEQHPLELYISDGTSGTITVPQGLEESINVPEGKQLQIN